MQDLEQYLTYLDEASEDVKDVHAITEHLKEIAQYLEQDGQPEPAWQARINQEVIAAGKSLTQGIGYHISFTQRDANGVEREFGWPDTTAYGTREYTYIRERYEVWRNLYFRSEYGLFLFLRKQLRTNEEVKGLADAFFRLGKLYQEKNAVDDGSKHYMVHALEAYQRAFYLANARKNDAAVGQLLRIIVGHLVAVHANWNLTTSPTLMVLARLTELFTEHFKALATADQAHELLAQNWRGVHQLALTYRHGAIELAELSSELAAKAGSDRDRWAVFQAQQYELLAQEAEQQPNLTAVTFVERALRIYRRLKDEPNSRRLEQEYQRLRTAFSLTKTSTPLPDDANQQLLQYIEETIAERDALGILQEVAMTPMFRRLDNVAEVARTQRDSFMAMFPSVIADKHGNTVQTFTTAEEKEQFQFLSTYGLLAQISTSVLVKLILEAFKADKLHATDVESYLRASWVGQPRWVESTGERELTHPLRLIMSGVNILFQELERWRQEPDYEPDFIACTDSLTLKVEYLLRYICARLGLPTFKLREGSEVIMEKLLDELLADLKSKLDEEDRFFIKFFLSEKVGQNLRNRVAHGLMDDTEYGVQNAFIVLAMILKLASYEFQPAR